MSLLKQLLGLGPKTNYPELVSRGAQIIDVRTSGEFARGHIPGSLNIPLDEIHGKLKKILKEKPVIVCCASGIRSSSARSVLSSAGYEVYNGGGWQSLQHKLKPR